MHHTLFTKTLTQDGHEAQIYRKRDARKMLRYVYHVSILSKVYYRDYRRAIIYGWSTTCHLSAIRDARAWTIDQLARDNPYLALEIARITQRNFP